METTSHAEHPRCPTCGHEFKSLPRIDAMIAALGLTGDQRRILTILSAARGSFLSAKQIASILYNDREDGGPECADDTVRTHVGLLRKALASYPVQIEARNRVGYRFWAIHNTYNSYSLGEAA